MFRITVFTIFMALMASCGGSGTEESADSTKVDETNEIPGKKDAPSEPVGRVFFVSPAEGDTVSSPVTVQMGVEGMEVEPAGMVVEGKGHHHLIIDGSFIEEGTMVPADETHIHYGQGQTETTLDLEPGTHTITMQFADGVHTSYGEAWSTTITVVVEGGSEE